MNTKPAVLFLALASAGAIAGEALFVSGTAKDPQGRVVPGAIVSLYSRASDAVVRTTTDAQGAYRFRDVAVGDYLLRAEATGFAGYLDGNVRVTASLTHDIALELAGVREQVVVTASGTSQSPAEISKTITVIDAAEVQQRDVFSIAGAVALAPGVRVPQIGGPGQLVSIRMRGLRNQDTAVLVDGQRLRDAGAIQGDATGLIQDLLVVDTGRIEVMNGAGSSLYGTNAVGGVVNILTDEGGGRTRGSVLAEGGSLGTARAKAKAAGEAAGGRIQYSGGLAHINVTSGVDGDDPFRDTSAQGRMAYHVSPSAVITARLYAGDSFSKLNSNPVQTGILPPTGIVTAVLGTTFLPGSDDPDSTRAGRFLSGALALAGRLSERFNYALSYQTLASSRRYGNGLAGTGFQPAGNQRTVYDGRIQTVNAQFHYQLAAANLVTGGYEFERENYAFDFADRSDPGAASAVNATQKSNAVFIQDQAQFLGGRVLVSGAFRAQSYTLDRPRLSPAESAPFQTAGLVSPPAAYTGDGSVAYFIRRTGTKMRAHVGRGYRAPSLYERFGAGFSSFFGYSTYGDPRLEPEHSISFDAGIDQVLANGKVHASATYFYTSLERVVAFGTFAARDTYGRLFGYFNSQGGLSRGVELSARVSPVRAVDLSAAYTFVNATERAPVVSGVWRTFVIPRNQFSAAAAWRAGSRAVFTFDTLDASNYLAPVSPDFVHAFTTRAYRFNGIRSVNAGASYRLPLGEYRAARFFVRAENLGDQQYFENGFRTPGRTANGGIQYEF